MGANYRMPELQAALINVAIERFPEQAEERAEMAAYMDEALSEVPGVRVLRTDPRQSARSFYRYIFAIDPQVFEANHDAVCRALQKEGIPAGAGYPPMYRYDLFQPTHSRLPVPSAFPQRFKFDALHLPEVERAAEREAVWLNENVFRAGREGVDDVVDALMKIYEHRAVLRSGG
jgi:dTDP-4-amino-4,6-dideoxygalactose transaminase